MSAETTQPRTVPPEIAKTLSHWRSQAIYIRVAHIALVVLAVGCSLWASTEVSGVGRVRIPMQIVSFIAALAISLLSAFELGSKANGMRNAWRILTAAVWRYMYEEDFPLEKLIVAYEEAEKKIGNVKESPTPH